MEMIDTRCILIYDRGSASSCFDPLSVWLMPFPTTIELQHISTRLKFPEKSMPTGEFSFVKKSATPAAEMMVNCENRPGPANIF